ncbi:MAG: metallophosphoesterase [Sphingobacteriales bacterium]
MQRRSFLKNIGLMGAAWTAVPSLALAAQGPSVPPRFKFITASDGHWGQPKTDFEGMHRNLIQAIQKEEQVNFIVFNGDLIHDNPALMPEVKKVYDGIGLPYYVTRGNHDRVSKDNWMEIWNQPEDHAFSVDGKVGVILLSSSNEAGTYLCADIAFLKAKLEAFRDLSHVFIFVHISQSTWTRYGVECAELLDTIAAYPNVKASFHGHDHDVDGLMVYKKKPFLWSGHFGGNWGNPFPTYRVCEWSSESDTWVTALKTVQDGMVLNKHIL